LRVFFFFFNNPLLHLKIHSLALQEMSNLIYKYKTFVNTSDAKV